MQERWGLLLVSDTGMLIKEIVQEDAQRLIELLFGLLVLCSWLRYAVITAQ